MKKNTTIVDDVYNKVYAEQNKKVNDIINIMFSSGDDISIPLIQRKCACGYNTASRVFDDLVSKGIIIRSTNQFGVSKFK